MYDISTLFVPLPDNLIDCKNCADEHGYPHQLAYHKGKKTEHGECMYYWFVGNQTVHCQCPGFEPVEDEL